MGDAPQPAVSRTHGAEQRKRDAEAFRGLIIALPVATTIWLGAALLIAFERGYLVG